MSDPEKAAEPMTPPAPPAEATPPATTPPTPKTDPKAVHVTANWKYSQPVFACRFDPKGRFVFSGAQDPLVTRWNVTSGASTTLTGHDSWVRAIAFSPDGETTLTAGYDGRLIWWPTAADAPTPLRTIDAHAGWIRSLAVSPNGQTVASTGNDGLVKLWNLADGQLVNTLNGHGCHVYSLLFHPGGEFLLSGDLNGQVRQWEAASGKHLRTFDAGALHLFDKGFMAEYGGVRSLALSPDGARLICGGLQKCTNAFAGINEPAVLVLEWESQKVIATLAASGELKGVVWRAMSHPDGYTVALSGGHGGGVLLFWKDAEPSEFHRFALPANAYDLDLSPDGLSLATANFDHHLRISRLAPDAAS